MITEKINCRVDDFQVSEDGNVYNRKEEKLGNISCLLFNSNKNNIARDFKKYWMKFLAS